MKKVQLFGFALVAVALTACGSGDGNNNGSDSTSTTTTTTTTDAGTTTNTSTGNYAAIADSFRVNSEAGNILDARTGKQINVRYDATTRRAVNAETNEPVWRYVDKRNWWVYGAENDSWNRVGEARMQNNTLQYKGDNDAWVDYDTRWKMDDERWMNDTTYMGGSGSTGTSGTSGSTDGGKVKVSDNGNKIKDENVKVKVSDDGDIKIKDKKTGEKIKYDGDDGKVKTDN
ncbi:hypothetical protein [Flaviaesturariibacter amylovorans]|uniref:Lipoprotein n=1 Tax=Flaviaesturariibacter amylovorans TaxID=1084520 RepID=A0ABP8HET2_9BACT